MTDSWHVSKVADVFCFFSKLHERERIQFSCLNIMYVCYPQTYLCQWDKPHNYSDFSGELSEGAESPEAEENKNKGVDGELVFCSPRLLTKK